MQLSDGNRRLGPGAMAALAFSALLVATVVVFGTAVPSAQAISTSNWTIVSGATTDPGSSNFLFGTTCATSWDCWAVAPVSTTSTSQHPRPAALFEHWNGTAWTADSAAAPARPEILGALGRDLRQPVRLLGGGGAGDVRRVGPGPADRAVGRVELVGGGNAADPRGALRSYLRERRRLLGHRGQRH